MKKLLFLSGLFIFGFASCSKDDSIIDRGVVIDGVRWATRNVDAPGTFAATPESLGMHFQWNRRTGWNTTDEIVEGMDRSMPEGAAWYAANDPCPRGWRVPTAEELRSLANAKRERTVQNGVPGFLFGIAPNQIFLPSAGARRSDGLLQDVNRIGSYWGSNHASWLRWWACRFFETEVQTFVFPQHLLIK